MGAVCGAAREVRFTRIIPGEETRCCRTSLSGKQTHLFGFRSKVWFWLRDANDEGGAGSERSRENKDSNVSASDRLPVKRDPFHLNKLKMEQCSVGFKPV